MKKEQRALIESCENLIENCKRYNEELMELLKSVKNLEFKGYWGGTK